MAVPVWMNFGKVSKEGGVGVIFNLKIYGVNFWELLTGLFEYEIDKKKSNFITLMWSHSCKEA